MLSEREMPLIKVEYVMTSGLPGLALSVMLPVVVMVMVDHYENRDELVMTMGSKHQ